MENFSYEIPLIEQFHTFWRIIWEVVFDCEFASKNSSLIWCSYGSLYFCLNVSDIGLIDDHADTYP